MLAHATLQCAVHNMTSQVIKSQPFLRERCPGQGVLFRGVTNLRPLDLLSTCPISFSLLPRFPIKGDETCGTQIKGFWLTLFSHS